MEMDLDEEYEYDNFYEEEVDRAIWNRSHDEPYESMWYVSESDSGKINNDPHWV